MMAISMRKWLAVTTSLIVIGLSSPFANGDEAQGAGASGTQAKPASEKAELYVINISGPTLFSSNKEITDNGSLIVSLPRMKYKKVSIAAGEHEFRFKSFPQGRRFAKLHAEVGKTYYLAAGYKPAKSWAFPIAGDPMVIKIISKDEAMKIMKDMESE